VSFPELPEKIRLAIVRFSYDGMCRVEQGQWIARIAPILAAHPRVADVAWSCPIGYPITCLRNAALLTAAQQGFHFVLFLDNDMIFDIHAQDGLMNYAHLPKLPNQQPFMPAALDFALEHPGPCVIAAPYCAGPPEERVLVHRFSEYEPNANHPTRGVRLQCFSREEVETRTGYEMVAALPTGMMLIDTRVTQLLHPPYFSYEYGDENETRLAGTEDVVFSRNLYYLGIPQFVSWDSWAAHAKTMFVGKPLHYPPSAYPEAIRKTWDRDIIRRSANQRPVDVLNEEAERILTELRQREKAEDADPVLPFEDDGQ
jgi:hypothetical protein